MDLGAFSISLAVKDLQASRAFYQKLGFSDFGGALEHNYLIMKNGEHVIGLFQGMFDRNMLTFNPGWDQNCAETANFTDIRQLQQSLREQGVETEGGPEEGSAGPGSLLIHDPDGNPILIDQHR